MIIWFTGLSGSGKTTIAAELAVRLRMRGDNVVILDGDELRGGLSRDLDFSEHGRAEQQRRTREVAYLLSRQGVVVIVATISPYKRDRATARARAPHHFVEVYISTPLETCEGRDPKGHYRKARAGELREFTGVDAPYEVPESPDLVLDTCWKTAEACASEILRESGSL